MRSRVRFSVVGEPPVGKAADYPAIGVTAEVVMSVLIALTVELEHVDAASSTEIAQRAREKLRNIATLIGVGSGFEPVLGAIHIRPVAPPNPSTPTVGMFQIPTKAYIARTLTSMPSPAVVEKLELDPRLRRQAEYLNSARAAEDVVTRIRYAYLVLEQEAKKSTGYAPSDSFRHVRHAVSHPELHGETKDYVQAQIGADSIDLRNPQHLEFLSGQCTLLMKEARRLVEKAIPQFWA